MSAPGQYPPAIDETAGLDYLPDLDERFESYEEFSRIVGTLTLNLAQILIPRDRRLPRGWDDFWFAALQVDQDDDSLRKPDDVVLPEGRARRFHLDAPNNIALMHRRWGMCAVAGAALDENGNMIVIGMQGYSTPREGLGAGVLWKESLLNAWIWAARGFGVTELAVLGSENSEEDAVTIGENRLIDVMGHQAYSALDRDHPQSAFEQALQIGQETLHRMLDKPADRMGFTQGHDGNWHISLASPGMGDQLS